MRPAPAPAKAPHAGAMRWRGAGFQTTRTVSAKATSSPTPMRTLLGPCELSSIIPQAPTSMPSQDQAAMRTP